MADFVSIVRPYLDKARAVWGNTATLNMRPWRVYAIKRTWSGARIGQGAKTDVVTEITCAGAPPKVKQLSDEDIVSSGGRYNQGDVRVGPLTPLYATSSGNGGVDLSTFMPSPVSGVPSEVFFKVTGPGYPAEGGFFKMLSNDGSFTTNYTFVLRQRAETP